MKKVLVIHGPNLNLLGKREPHLYGFMTFQYIDEELVRAGQERGIDVGIFQSNHQGDIVERIQRAPQDGYGAIIINPAAFTNTSVAIRDALAGCGLPFVEAHISNINAREMFRRKSLFPDIASDVLTGFGSSGCRLALMGVQDLSTSSVNSGEE